MTTKPAHAPATARALLFPSEDPEAALRRLLRVAGVAVSAVSVLGAMPVTNTATIESEAAHAAATLLELDLVGLLIGAWRTEGSLVAAARATVATPGSEERVQLKTQRITWTRRPWIDVIVDGVHLHPINLELRLDFDVTEMEAEVRGGRLVDLKSGYCKVQATLGIEGHELPTRSGSLDLPVVVPVGSGVPLLSKAEVAQARAAARARDDQADPDQRS
jgi:hypothetical protein